MTKKVYIVDDDIDFLEILTYILKKNYRILTASALKTEDVALFQPDLILMDNAVGSEISEKMIRRLNTEIPSFATPVILVSAHHDISKLAAIKGVNGFIRKPSSIGYIRSYIDNFFNNNLDSIPRAESIR
jgi:response regulator RpfG family c-di-GMP phosphodiesterase